MTAEKPTVVFFPEGAFGPTNNCVGVADVLRRRGARCVFVVEESFAGTLEAKGFEEARMRLKPPPEVEEEPGQFWKDFVRDTAPEFRKPTIEQLETFIKPTWEELWTAPSTCSRRLAEIFDDVPPTSSSRTTSSASRGGRRGPLGPHRSCNPLEMKDPDLPPTFSGYPTEDPDGWNPFRRRYQEGTRTCWRASATSA